MGIFNFLKKKKTGEGSKDDFIVPPAPPSSDELPELPSEKELEASLQEEQKASLKTAAPKADIPKPTSTTGEKRPGPAMAPVEKKPEPVKKPRPAPSFGPNEFEEKAAEDTQQYLEDREALKVNRPLFVSIDSYKDMVDEIGLISSTLKEGEDALGRITDLKEEEEKEYHNWETSIRDIQKKLIYADKTLFG